MNIALSRELFREFLGDLSFLAHKLSLAEFVSFRLYASRNLKGSQLRCGRRIQIVDVSRAEACT